MWCHLKVMHVDFYNHPPTGIDSLSGCTKGPGEEGEQLVSLVWKRRAGPQLFYDPCLSIRARPKAGWRSEVGGGAQGAKSKAGAGEKAISWPHRLGRRRLSLPIRFTCDNSRCCSDGEGKDIKSSRLMRRSAGTCLALKSWTVLHVRVVHHLFSLWQLQQNDRVGMVVLIGCDLLWHASNAGGIVMKSVCVTVD